MVKEYLEHIDFNPKGEAGINSKELKELLVGFENFIMSKRKTTAREAVEKAWKDFRLSTGLPYKPMSEKAYECFEKHFNDVKQIEMDSGIKRIDVVEEIYQKWHELDNDLGFCQWLYNERNVESSNIIRKSKMIEKTLRDIQLFETESNDDWVTNVLKMVDEALR
jgi:hypothetical protein